MFLEILGWVALALNIWGNLALTKKGIRGWIIRLACNACWIPYSIYTGAWALLANHATFAVINIYGWYKWSHELHEESNEQAKHKVELPREV